MNASSARRKRERYSRGVPSGGARVSKLRYGYGQTGGRAPPFRTRERTCLPSGQRETLERGQPSRPKRSLPTFHLRVPRPVLPKYGGPHDRTFPVAEGGAEPLRRRPRPPPH